MPTGESITRCLVMLHADSRSMMIHVPLTSLFHPILAIPNTIQTILTPSQRLLELSWSAIQEGGLRSTANQFYETAAAGGGMKLVNSALAFRNKQLEEKLAQRRAEMAKERERMEEKLGKVGRDLDGKE